MTAPVLGNTTSAVANAASSNTFTVTTAHDNAVVYLIVMTENLTGTTCHVSTITGLPFVQRGSEIVHKLPSQFHGDENFSVSMWVASVPTAGATSVTVNFTGTADGTVCTWGEIYNVFCAASYPFDSASFPVTGEDDTTVPTLTYSTAQADDLLLLAVISGRSGTYGTAPSGWVGGMSGTAGGGSVGEIQIVAYQQTFSATQSGQTVAGPSNSPFPAISILEAFTADANGHCVSYQTFVTTICT